MARRSIVNFDRYASPESVQLIAARMTALEARFAAIESAQAGYNNRLDNLEDGTVTPTPTPTPTPAGFRAGANVGGANYFTDTAIHLNWGKNVSINAVNGFGTGYFFFPRVVHNGTYTVTTPIATSLGAPFPNTAILSTGGTTHQVQITADSDGDRYFTYSGVVGSTLAWVSAAANGVSGTFIPAAIAGMAGFKVMRNLDMGWANATPLTGHLPYPDPTDHTYPSTGVGGIVPYQDQADFISAVMAQDSTFEGLWDVIDPGLTDSEITARYTYFRDNMPTRTKIRVQLANEDPWNAVFGGARRMFTDAARYGHYDAGTFSNPTTPIIADVDIGYWEDGNSNIPPIGAFSTNAILSANRSGVGMALYKAKRNVAQGSSLPAPNTTENADWSKIPIIDYYGAACRWRSIRHNQAIELIRTVFGETRFQAQIIPVVMFQATGELIDQSLNERTYVPGYWAKVKSIGHGGYFGHDPNIAYNFTGATIQNLKANLYASMPFYKNVLISAAANCATLGKTFEIYEFGTHPNFDLYTDTTSAYRAAWDGFMNSADGQAYMAEIAAFYKATIPGVGCYFNLVGADPWRLKRKWSDTTSKRIVGWNQGLVA